MNNFMNTNDLVISLDEACITGEIESIEAAIDRDPEAINLKDAKLGWTPLFRAVISGQTSAVDLLLRRGADPDVVSDQGESPLHQAVFQSHYQIAHLLLRASANVNSQEEEGFTPLHYAVSRSDIHMLEILLKHRADPNLLSYKLRRSPLHISAEKADEIAVKVLINHGANPYEPDSNLQSPIDLASSNSIRKILEECKSENYSKTSIEITSLELPQIDFCSKISHIEIQQGKFYYWLERSGLQDYFEAFARHGFHTLDDIINKTKGPVPFNSLDLKMMGIYKAGHRYKLLIKLDEDAGIDKNHKFLTLYRSQRACCADEQVLEEVAMKEWLQSGNLEEVYDQFQEEGYDLELILLQAQSAYTLSSSIMKNEIGIHDLQVRNKLSKHIIETLSSRNSLPFSIYYNRRSSCQQCFIL